MAKAKMIDTTTLVVDPLNTTNHTCEAHQDRHHHHHHHHHHQRKRKRDKVINSDSDSDENIIAINTSHQQRKRERERKEERKKKEKKEKKQLKFKTTHELEEPISRKKKRQRLDSSTLTSAIHDPAPVQDLRSEVNKKKKKEKKKEKTRDRDQLKGEVEEDGRECRNHKQKHAKSKKGLVPMTSEGLESKKKKRRELQVE